MTQQSLFPSIVDQYEPKTKTMFLSQQDKHWLTKNKRDLKTLPDVRYGQGLYGVIKRGAKTYFFFGKSFNDYVKTI